MCITGGTICGMSCGRVLGVGEDNIWTALTVIVARGETRRQHRLQILSSHSNARLA